MIDRHAPLSARDAARGEHGAAAPNAHRSDRFKASLKAALTPPKIDIENADPDRPEETMIDARIPMKSIPIAPKG